MNADCEKCGGACCKLIVFRISEEDINLMERRGAAFIGGRCVLECRCKSLKEGKCADYEHRPQSCRDFQVGGALCLFCKIAQKKMKEAEL